MSVFVLLVMAVAIAQPISALSPAEEHTCSSTADQRSVLSNMLIMTGYSEVCIAAALDDCGAGHGQSSYAQLIEVVQQLSATVNKLDSQLSAVVNMSETLVSASANKLDSHLSAVVNKLDSHLSAVVNMSDATVNKLDSHLSAVTNISDTLVSAAANECACQVCRSLPRHCRDLLDSGDSGSGIRKIYPYADRPNLGVDVFCDQSVDGGGWTVFQRRTSEVPRENFQRNWTDYQTGFGNKTQEFWLGLDLLHQLTAITNQQLRIDLEDYEGSHRYAKYGYFHVDGPETNYRLSVRDYSGDAGDSLTYNDRQEFSTHDADNDRFSSGNCAEERRGAWWYDYCTYVNLNGYQYVGISPLNQGINWKAFRGDRYSLKSSSMKTRPVL